MSNKILVIEDELLLLHFLKQRLEKEKYVVDIACDGKEALQLLESLKYSIIILDLMLPFVSGFELIGKIRSDKRNLDTPILVLSALSSEESISESLAMGASGFLKKPFATEELLSKVEHFAGGINLIKTV